MFALGFDVGSSSIKCALVDLSTGLRVAHATCPDAEMPIAAPHPGWAEQDPELWWEQVIAGTRQLLRRHPVDPAAVACIGISYQMHGLVIVDSAHKPLRPSIIWCDSRAVEIGEQARTTLGHDYCQSHLLNSPGNFTASKLRWVRLNEPHLYDRIWKSMLPGEYIGLRMTGDSVTTPSGLSEGVYWDFKEGAIAKPLLKHFDINEEILPDVKPTFSMHGALSRAAADALGLRPGIPLTYRAGDQPNNAFSLNVLQPGEVAATAGTSGVVYAVAGENAADPRSRVNSFLHVSHTAAAPRVGVLLCINGTGSLNSWLRRTVVPGQPYAAMNDGASRVPIGSGGVSVLPFGNGAERMLENKTVGGQVHGLDFNRHTRSHLFRASQEGIAFGFRYGIDILRSMGMEIRMMNAGRGNMFLSPLFRQTLATCAGVTVRLYETDGAEGAARGAAVGAGLVSTESAFSGLATLAAIDPCANEIPAMSDAYERWCMHLNENLNAAAGNLCDAT